MNTDDRTPCMGDTLTLYGRTYRVLTVEPRNDWTWDVRAVSTEPIAGEHEILTMFLPSEERTTP